MSRHTRALIERSPSLDPGSAIVVGGSLAGLMTGLALARSGVSVTILERSARPRSGGVLLDLHGDAHDLVLRRDGSGILVPSLAAVASGGTPSTEGWSTVHGRLLAAVRAEQRATVIHAARVIDVGQSASRAWAVTDTGTRFERDVLIGADGHRSVVRATVDPSRPHASFAGYTVWTGTVPSDRFPADTRGYDWYHPTTTRDGDVLDVGEVTLDGNSRQFMWQWYDPEHTELLEAEGAVRGGVVHHSLVGHDLPENITEMLTKETRRWPRLWATVAPESIARRSIIGTPVAEYLPERVVNGRVALVGDAAHVPSPRTGSGFEVGREDAEALGELSANGLRGQAGADALAAYEVARLPAGRNLVRRGMSFSRSYAG